MSREERRNYERMMRNVDRGPALPPAARARAERNAARRAARRTEPSAPGRFTTRFLVMSVLISVALGYGAFSTQWPNVPFAFYVGAIVAIVAFVVQLGIQLARRRIAPR